MNVFKFINLNFTALTHIFVAYSGSKANTKSGFSKIQTRSYPWGKITCLVVAEPVMHLLKMNLNGDRDSSLRWAAFGMTGGSGVTGEGSSGDLTGFIL